VAKQIHYEVSNHQDDKFSILVSIKSSACLLALILYILVSCFCVFSHWN